MQERVAVLKRGLDPQDRLYLPKQKQNLEALINMYENGEIQIGPDVIFLVDGKIVPEDEAALPRKIFWREVSLSILPLSPVLNYTDDIQHTGEYHQLAQKVAYGHGIFPTSHEV